MSIGNSAPIGWTDQEFRREERQAPSATVDVRDREREWKEWGHSLNLGLDTSPNEAHDPKAASSSQALS